MAGLVPHVCLGSSIGHGVQPPSGVMRGRIWAPRGVTTTAGILVEVGAGVVERREARISRRPLARLCSVYFVPCAQVCSAQSRNAVPGLVSRGCPEPLRIRIGCQSASACCVPPILLSGRAAQSDIAQDSSRSDHAAVTHVAWSEKKDADDGDNTSTSLKETKSAGID